MPFSFLKQDNSKRFLLGVTCLIAIIGVLVFVLLDTSEGSKEQAKAPHSPNLLSSSSNRPETVSVKPQVQELKPVIDEQHSPNSAPKATPVLEKDKVIDNLREASVTYDKVALPGITPYLASADPDVRQEAINAVVNIGDPAGAPFLRSQAAREADFNKKKELLDLADWLELPSATLILPKRKSGKAHKSAPASAGKAL
jgi:hypothetical protein